MNIKNKLYISAGISIVLVVALVSVVLVTSGRVAEESKKYELLDDVRWGVSALDVVTYDYLLQREERMEQQWNIRYSSLGEILEKAEEEGLKSILADYATLGNLFSQVTENYRERQKSIQEGTSQEKIDVATGLEERLVAQLLITSHSIFTDAFRLAEDAQAEVMEAQRLAANLTLILITILAITVATSSLVVARNISKPLDKLTKGAEIIGKGDLEHKVDIKTRDELGQLAAAFNKMTGNLIRNITERKQAEEELRKHREHLEELVKERTKELREAQERLNGIYNSSKDAIGFASDDGTLVDVNEAFCQLTGYSRKELLSGKNFQEITPEEYHEWESRIVGGILRTGSPAEYEKEYLRKDGSRVPVLLTIFVVRGEDGEPIGVAAIIKNVTEFKEMQEKLVRSERLAVLGQLAGGVGHELRNPLGAIKNAAYFLNMALEKPEPEVKETLDILEKEVATSERIVSSLLDFARPKLPTRRKMNINEVVQETLSRTTLLENVKVVRQLDESLPEIMADSDQLRVVFSNIIRNGIQAMPEGGQLTVASEVFRPGWVAVSIADTGVGIPPEEQQEVFEPLFTTKAKGIGLGLAVTSTLVVGHGGTIEVQSKLGKGSTFTVRLPINEEKEN